MSNENVSPLSDEGYIASSVALFSIGVGGFFLNLCIIILVLKDKQLWTPLNFILMNLVISDISVSIVSNPFALLSSINKSWYFGYKICVAYGFFMSLFGINSIITLTVLAFERYLIVSGSLRRRGGFQFNYAAARWSIFGIWIISLILTVPPLIGWGEYGPEAANISCSINWESKNVSTSSYIIFLFSFGFFVPLFVIIFSYVNIVKIVKMNKASFGGRVSKSEGKVTWMVAIMIIAFFVAWTPYAVVSLLIVTTDIYIKPSVATLPSLFAKSSICYNPIIYFGLNTQFRAAGKRLLGYKETIEDSAVTATTIQGQRLNMIHMEKIQSKMYDNR